MSETDSEKVIFILCEWTAGTWVYFSIERFLSGKTGTGFVLVCLAILFAVVGVKWPSIKLKVQSRFPAFPSTAERIANNRWVRSTLYSVIAIAVLASMSIGIYRYYHKPPPQVAIPEPPPTVVQQSDIKIGNIQIGWVDSQEILHVDLTSRTTPGTGWAANVHYVNRGTQSHDVAYYSAGAFFDGMKTHDRQKINEMEDREWNKFLVETQTPTTTIEVAPKDPIFSTFKGIPLNAEQLRHLVTYQAMYYFFAFFTYKDGQNTFHSEMCVYREGNSPAVHQCHDHNNP